MEEWLQFPYLTDMVIMYISKKYLFICPLIQICVGNSFITSCILHINQIIIVRCIKILALVWFMFFYTSPASEAIFMAWLYTILTD